MDGRGGLSAALNKKKTRRAYQSISMETEREGGGEGSGWGVKSSVDKVLR